MIEDAKFFQRPRPISKGMNGNPVVVSQSREEETDASVLKLVFLAFVVAVLLWAAVYFFNQFLLTGRYDKLFLSVVLGGFFLAFTALCALLVKGSKKLSVMMLVGILATLGIFYDKLYPAPSRILLGGAAVASLLMIFAVGRGIKTANNNLKINFFGTAKQVIPKAATGFFIFLSVVLYLQYFEWGKFDERVGKAFVFQTLAASEPLLKIFYNNFSFNQSIGDFLKVIAETQLRKSRPDLLTKISSDFNVDFGKLPESAKKKLIEQVAGELQKSMLSLFGPFNKETSVKEYVFSLIKRYFENLPLQIKSVFGIIVALSAFFIFKGLAVPFYWLIGVTAFLIYQFLLAINFAHVSLETRNREFVILS